MEPKGENLFKPTLPYTSEVPRRGKTMEYEYNTIEEIQVRTDHGANVGKKALNLFGVVKHFRPPAKSRGSDHFCILRIVDESCYENNGIQVTLFHKDEKMLPRVNELDVVRLHRVKPCNNDGEMVLMSSWGWSLVQWDGQDKEVGDGKTYSQTYTIWPKDKDRVKQLKDWVKTLLNSDSAGSSLSETEHKLENVTREGYFSMICQVTGIIKLDNLTVLRVWDGSTCTLNIPFIPDIEKDGMMKTNDLSLVEHLMVDICAYDEHSVYITENNVTLGSYILLHNLHCKRKKEAKGEFELIMHGGVCFDRGVNLLDDNDPKLEEIKKKTNEVLSQAKKMKNLPELSNIQSTSSAKKIIHSSQYPSSSEGTLHKKKRKFNESFSSQSDDSYNTPPKNKNRITQQCFVNVSPLPQNFTVEKVSFLSDEESDTLDVLEHMDSEKISQDGFLHSKETSLIDEDSEIDVVGTQGEEEDLRCQLNSSTVVFGDSPFEITNISTVTSTDIPTSKTKLFRVRVKINKFSNLHDSVIHYCPATNLRITATNNGNNIELTKDVVDYLHLWRRFRGLNDEDSDCDFINDKDKVNEEETQIILPNNEIKITTYTDSKDDSIWYKFEVDKETVIHKLKQGSDRFNILYTMNINSKADFEKFSKKYDRVVHVLSREELIADSMPPVCYQDGVFYYCSPGCIGRARIPTLSQEAKTFRAKQPLQALNCPLLLHRFYFQINISDQSGILDDLLLQGKNAVDFFNGITPFQYLRNDEDCTQETKDEVYNLTDSQNNNFLELIIEKKSRKSIELNKADVILYDIINTRLKKIM